MQPPKRISGSHLILSLIKLRVSLEKKISLECKNKTYFAEHLCNA